MCSQTSHADLCYVLTGSGKPPSSDGWPHFSNYSVEGVMEANPLELHTATCMNRHLHSFSDTVTIKHFLCLPLFIFSATCSVWTGLNSSCLLSACPGLSFLPVVGSLCPRMLTDRPRYVCMPMKSQCALCGSHT